MHDEEGWAIVVNLNEKRLIFDSVSMLLTDLHIDPDKAGYLNFPSFFLPPLIFSSNENVGMANEFRFSFGGIHSLLLTI